jgi:hypothetical protein
MKGILMNVRYFLQAGAAVLLTAIPLWGQSSSDCFFQDFVPKYTAPPSFQTQSKTSATPTVTVIINAADTLGKVSKYIYGNNANTYMTQMIDQLDLISHISLLSPRIIRYPGGNLSSIFFWDTVGHQPSDAPDSLIDGVTGRATPAGYWYGKNSGSWTLSVDNYYAMLNATGSTGMITVNYGYARYGTGPTPAAAAAHYAADWVRYDNGRTMFWEIGNESDGAWQRGYRIDTNKNQDGQPMIVTGKLYGKHFKIFIDSMRQAAQEIGSTIYIGAQLVHNYVSPPDADWNAGLFSEIGDSADFFIVHNYFGPYQQNSNASTILGTAAPDCQSIMQYVTQAADTGHVSMKPVALTEWNINAIGSKQSCSFVSGLHAALTLGEMAKNGYSMAARWDLANGYDNGDDHGMFSMGGETPAVPLWNPRPSFFYMYYFQKFFGDHLIGSEVRTNNSIAAYASTFASGHKGIVVVNKGATEQIVQVRPWNYGFGERYYIYSLTGGSDNGEFSQSVYVNGEAPTNASGGPIGNLAAISAWAYPATGDDIIFTSPARSVQYILLEPGTHTVDVEKGSPKIASFRLSQNYPNPFNPKTIIAFSVGTYSYTSLRVYDILGREVATLEEGMKTPGSYSITFNGSQLASGVYYYRLQTENFVETKPMLLIR